MMQSATRLAVSALLITSTLASVYQSPTKLARRDGVLNLYPFPRVGRTQKQNWQVPLDDPDSVPNTREVSIDPGDAAAKDREYHRRQMVDQPHIGRSDLPIDLDAGAEDLEYQKRRMFDHPRIGRSDLPIDLENAGGQDREYQKRWMFDHPRVGRSDLSVDLGDAGAEGREYQKRQRFAYPRIGRSDLSTDLGDAGAEDQEYQKRQRFAYPRVGRSDLSIDLGDAGAEDREYQKRQRFAYPRVGRSDLPFIVGQMRSEQLRPPPQAYLPQSFRPHPMPPKPAILDQRGQFPQDVPTVAGSKNSPLHELMTLMLGLRRNSLVKRESATDTSGMWFGPRLGRAVKENEDTDIDKESTMNDHDQPESTRLNEERKKRQIN